MLAIGMQFEYPTLRYVLMRTFSLLLWRSSREQNWYQVGSCYRLNVLPDPRLGILLQQQIWERMGE
jgi:hypothetical protein